MEKAETCSCRATKAVRAAGVHCSYLSCHRSSPCLSLLAERSPRSSLGCHPVLSGHKGISCVTWPAHLVLVVSTSKPTDAALHCNAVAPGFDLASACFSCKVKGHGASPGIEKQTAGAEETWLPVAKALKHRSTMFQLKICARRHQQVLVSIKSSSLRYGDSRDLKHVCAHDRAIREPRPRAAAAAADAHQGLATAKVAQEMIFSSEMQLFCQHVLARRNIYQKEPVRRASQQIRQTEGARVACAQFGKCTAIHNHSRLENSTSPHSSRLPSPLSRC